MFSLSFWVGFTVIILAALAIDLGIFNKIPKIPTFKNALFMSSIWVGLALIFAIILYIYTADIDKTLEFITGYLVELSLSIDNVFIFILIFSSFKVEPKLQHRVLFWGIIGAILMRLIMITGGIYLIKYFQWIFYIFGAFLIYSSYKIAFTNHSDINLKESKLLKFLKRHINITEEYHGDKFMIKKNGRIVFTPLFLVLILVEKADAIFAMDSIPAILAITQDTFIVFTSNVFAILGLRSLYFVIAQMVDRFTYLKYGLGIILAYIGVKMILLAQGTHIPASLSVSVIISVIVISILVSLFKTKHR